MSKRRSSSASESSDDSSIEEYTVPAKRPRADTYGASSSSSHGSDSDDETAGLENVESDREPSQEPEQKPLHEYENNLRLSRSSLSDPCSSPNDEERATFDNNSDNDEESQFRPSFNQSNENTFTNNTLNGFQDMDKYSGTAKNIMGKMGYKFGKGLGKNEHGRVEPVLASTQKGRRGLGSQPSSVGVIPTNFAWSPDDAKPEANEKVSWMSVAPMEILSEEILNQWLQKGTKKLTIDDETNFVDANILKGVLSAKSIFDCLDDEDLRNARFRSNPYETIGSVMFLNRAAVKMANLDAVFNFMFTKPKTPDGKSAVDRKEVLYFADVCAGPGGFSEYVLYRRGWKAKGFGFTLKGKNDFKLSNFYAGTPETFNPYYGVDNDGDIFKPHNLESLKYNVLKHTNGKGVHFLMADGGFSVEGQENIQEILSKQLYLCQCLAALMIVRTGGHFVVKLFDVFTLFSVGLIYLMRRCFDKVSIHKPVTSRPANSERYLVCMGKRSNTGPVEDHLFAVNSFLWSNKKQDDVLELVPLKVIQEDREFFNYIYTSNCKLGEKQIKNLLKIATFSKDRNLKETSQAEMKEKCLKLWLLPDKVRTHPDKLQPEDMLQNIFHALKRRPAESHSLHSYKQNVLSKPPQHCLDDTSVLETFKNVFDWHFVFLSSKKTSPDLSFFIGCGGKQVYQLDGTRWKSIVDLKLTLPAKTLIYGEIIKEYEGQGSNQMFTKVLHVIDAVMLGGVDVSHLPLTERINQCELFCTALNKPFEKSCMSMKCKQLFNMEKFSSVVQHLKCHNMKIRKLAVTMDAPSNTEGKDVFYTVDSVLFIKEIKNPWIAQISKTSGQKYYYSMGADHKPISIYHITEGASLDMLSAFANRVIWSWEPNSVAVFKNERVQGTLSRNKVEDYIYYNMHKR